MTVQVEISYGELIDKMTILEIKLENVADAGKLANIERELEVLRRARAEAIPQSPELAELDRQLKDVNATLWGIEDDIRDCERRKDFGAAFIELARAVYHQNDLRARLKRDINDILGSPLVEEKLYQAY